MLPSLLHFDKATHVQWTRVKSDPNIHAIDQDSRGRDSRRSRHQQAKEKASQKRELMALSGSATSPLDDLTAMSHESKLPFRYTQNSNCSWDLIISRAGRDLNSIIACPTRGSKWRSGQA